jgi:hemoglobin-like flavoprotein
MITDDHKQAIQRSWRLVVPIAETAADLFYRRLFELRPDYQSLFTGDMASQKKKLVRMLAFIVKSLDWTEAEWQTVVSPDEDLMLVVLAMGRRHSELYRIPDDSYGVVAEALLWTLGYGLGDAFTDDVKEAWVEVYTVLAKAMRMGGLMADSGMGAPSSRRAQDLGQAALKEQQVAVGIDESTLGWGGQA